MTMDYSLHPVHTPRPKRRWLDLILILGFFICLVIGVAALVTLWTVSQPPGPLLNSSPFALLDPEHVAVGLAVRQLAGDSPTHLVMQATQAGELPTAAALLLYNTEANGSNRVSLWRQLAQRLGENEPAAAALAYKQVLNLGVLDPALRSLERSQVLSQSAEGFLDNDDLPAARSAAAQALRAITQSPDLLPAQRSQLLTQLKPVVEKLNTPQLSAQVDDFLRNPFIQANGALAPNSIPLLVAPPPYDAAVEEAVATRRQAARNLADRYVLTSGVDVEPEQVALANALLKEDQVRSVFYRTLLDSPISLQQQLSILLEQRNWTILKLQVAQKAFGLSIVPAWESDSAGLVSELDRLNTHMATVSMALADAQPTSLEQALLHTEATLITALQSALGLFPGANNQEIGERLRVAQAEMGQNDAPPAMPIAYEADAYPSGFRIQQSR